jgi:hypothetical protein
MMELGVRGPYVGYVWVDEEQHRDSSDFFTDFKSPSITKS